MCKLPEKCKVESKLATGKRLLELFVKLIDFTTILDTTASQIGESIICSRNNHMNLKNVLAS